MMLAGEVEAAKAMIAKNTELIRRSGAKTLVTSCPICFRIFRQNYNLKGIEILHHSQYIDRLIQDGKITVKYSPVRSVYHDPCDLGRGSGVYDEPRRLINAISILDDARDSRKDSLCCGASLADTVLGERQRRDIAHDAFSRLTEKRPDVLYTACPLCKKTFVGVSEGFPVEDIAQAVARNIIPNGK